MPMPRKPDPPIHGIFNLNKPRGVTSFAMVSLVRRITGVRRVGHAGTLDPIADGVLPICVGQATRVVEQIVGAPKLYRGTVLLGITTDTYDSDGTVVATGDPSGVTEADVRRVLPEFSGRIRQVPPMFSAVKHQGTALYRYARRGEEIERAAREVMVYRIDLLKFEPPRLYIEVEAGRGAYVRAIAHDLGQRLGCGAHLEALTRARSGPFRIEDAVTPETLQEAAVRGDWLRFLLPADEALLDWRAAILGAEHVRRMRDGGLLLLEPAHPHSFRDLAPGARCRAYGVHGEFLGTLVHERGAIWRPDRVFAPGRPESAAKSGDSAPTS